MKVCKGSRHIGFVSLGERLALRVGHRDPARRLEECKGDGDCVLPSTSGAVVACVVGLSSLMLPPCTEQPSQNRSGPGESDCLIKTKHCDNSEWIFIRCKFCPVL